MAIKLVHCFFPQLTPSGQVPNAALFAMDFAKKEFIVHVVRSRTRVMQLLEEYAPNVSAIRKIMASMLASDLPPASDDPDVTVVGIPAAFMLGGFERGVKPVAAHELGIKAMLTLPFPDGTVGAVGAFVTSPTEGYVYILRSLDQFEEMTRRHRVTIDASHEVSAMLGLEKDGLPQTSTSPMLVIDGPCGLFFSAGFDALNLNDDPSEPAPSTPRPVETPRVLVGKTMTAYTLPNVGLTRKELKRMDGAIFFVDERGEQSITLFHGKQQGRELIRSSNNDQDVKNDLLKRIDECPLEEVTTRDTQTVASPAVETLHEAFGIQTETPKSTEELRHDARVHKEVLDMFLPKPGKFPDAIFAVMRTQIDKQLHICYSKQQLRELVAANADILGKTRQKLFLKGIDKARMPETSDLPMATIKDSVGFRLYRGLHLLLKRTLSVN